MGYSRILSLHTLEIQGKLLIEMLYDTFCHYKYFHFYNEAVCEILHTLTGNERKIPWLGSVIHKLKV